MLPNGRKKQGVFFSNRREERKELLSPRGNGAHAAGRPDPPPLCSPSKEGNDRRASFSRSGAAGKERQRPDEGQKKKEGPRPASFAT